MMERVNTLSRPTKTSTSVALVAIVVVAGYGWIVSPYVTYLHAVQRCEPVVQQTLEKKNTMSNALGQKRRQLETVRAREVVLRDRFFTPARSRLFFADLEGWCVAVGCKVLALDCAFGAEPVHGNGPADGPTVTRHRAHLVVSGPYQALVGLLERLQTSPQQVGIDTCRMELSDVRTGRLRCELTLSIWVIPDEEDATNV
jgi:hypothetical protein